MGLVSVVSVYLSLDGLSQLTQMIGQRVPPDSLSTNASQAQHSFTKPKL